MRRRWPAALLSFALAGCAAIPFGRPTTFPSPPTNPQLLDLPAGRWIMIHQQ
jgi:hypothetical protein